MKQPNPNYDLFDGDKVFVDLENEGKKFFKLEYSEASAAWVLIPYTNYKFHTQKTNTRTGKVEPSFLYEYGYESVQRVADFDSEYFEEPLID